MQRRQQKVIEERPLRACPKSCAVMRATAVGNSRASRSTSARAGGTSTTRSARAFIEMNTRLQVEHPISEAIAGVDLVREQLRIASGESSAIQDDIGFQGHAFEFRINAEDPDNNFMPSPGRIELLDISGGPGVRADFGFAAKPAVVPYYDSLLGKLIVWDTDRDRALARAARALGEDRDHRDQDDRAADAATGRPRALRDAVTTPPTSSRCRICWGWGALDLPDEARYSWGGDEFLVIEIAPDMSLEANFVSNSIATALGHRGLDGIVDICPANASLLMLRSRPSRSRRCWRASCANSRQRCAGRTAVFWNAHHRDAGLVRRSVYACPGSGEGFHQEPTGTDLDYSARSPTICPARRSSSHGITGPVAGLDGGLRRRSAVHRTSSTVTTLDAEYLSPRTDTAYNRDRRLLLVHYSVRGAGRYQMLGITPTPIYDPEQSSPTSRLLRSVPGGRHREVSPGGRDRVSGSGVAGRRSAFRYRRAPRVVLARGCPRGPDGYSRTLLEALDVA